MRRRLTRLLLSTALVAWAAGLAGCNGWRRQIHDCNDGIDNDGDGLVDAQDPGCRFANDSETPDQVWPACDDGVDNDGDGRVDFPADPGCTGAKDPDEFDARAPECNDGFDNDGDGLIDFPWDPGCVLPLLDDERDGCPDGAQCPRCGNGVDDDGDGQVDYPGDVGCDSAADPEESNANTNTCGTFVNLISLPPGGETTGAVQGNGQGELISPTCGGSGAETALAVEVPARAVLVVTTDFMDTTLDTVVYVRTECRDIATELGCNDDAGGLASTLELLVEPGTYYVIIDAHHAGSSGDFHAQVAAYVPPGDGCGPESFPCMPGYVCRLRDANAQATTCEVPACQDGRDNDLDGYVDYPDDPGCDTPADNDESDDCPGGAACPECSNGVDDDGDGWIDYTGNEPGCDSAADSRELDPCVPGREVEILDSTNAQGAIVAGPSLLGGSCSGSGTAEKVYSYALDRDLISLNFSTVGSSFDTVTYVRLDDCGSPSSELACADDFMAGETLTLSSPARGTYFVVVDGDLGTGSFALEVGGVIPGGQACDETVTSFVCEPGFTCAGAACVPAVCNNGVDDDSDGFGDYPADPGCNDISDMDEADDCPLGAMCPACGNGADDDSDGFGDYPSDPGCDSAADTYEVDPCLPGVEVWPLPPDGATGTTAGASRLSGSCGGMFAGEEVFFFELGQPLESLAFSTVNSQFDTVTHVRLGDCASAAAEVACADAFGAGEEVVIPSPAQGTYFVIVDGRVSAGTFALQVTGKIPAGGLCDPGDSHVVCTAGHACVAGRCVAAACNNRIDDDGDGFADYPGDPGCARLEDNDESDSCPNIFGCPRCGDGVDNDGDGAIDYPGDPGCASAGDNDEEDCAGESDPVEVVRSGMMTGTTAGLTHDFVPGCAGVNAAPDKVFVLNVTTPLRSLTVDTDGSGYDTMLSIKSPSCAEPDLACDNDSGTGNRSRIELTDLEPGAYIIVVDGYNLNKGSFVLNVHGVIRGGARCDPALLASGLYACEAGYQCLGGTCTPAM